jgi:hypothetical protein
MGPWPPEAIERKSHGGLLGILEKCIKRVITACEKFNVKGLT